jgi:hypothetical protein
VPFDCSRTHRHHYSYHDEDPLKDTIEVCPKCHGKAESETIHKAGDTRVFNLKVDVATHKLIGEIGKLGETYGDVIKRVLFDYLARHRTKL